MHCQFLLTMVLRPKRLKNHTLWGGTYLYSLYRGESPGEATPRKTDRTIRRRHFLPICLFDEVSHKLTVRRLHMSGVETILCFNCLCFPNRVGLNYRQTSHRCDASRHLFQKHLTFTSTTHNISYRFNKMKRSGVTLYYPEREEGRFLEDGLNSELYHLGS